MLAIDNIERLLIKEFIFEYKNKSITYNQLSFYDCLDFHYQRKNDNIKIDWFEKILGLTKEELENFNFVEFMTLYETTAMRDFYSDKKLVDGPKLPDSAFFLYLADYDPNNVLDIIKKYTPEGIKFLIDGKIYWDNEKTEEGQKKNKIRNTVSDRPVADYISDVERLKALKYNK